jgi:hypothetical protein
MLHAILSRPSIMKLSLAFLFAAQMLGWISYACAVEPAGTTAPPPSPENRPALRAALREFDRFLDHHPVVEERLRPDPQLATNQNFLQKNADLRDFMSANPNVADGLKLYPRYYFNRALLRQASEPVSFRELAPFRDLFLQQPKLEQALTEDPELIRDPAFLASNPALRDCLVQHAVLARAFLPPVISPDPK